MSEVALSEQLDQAIDAMLRDRPALSGFVDHQKAELVRIAAELRDLPSAAFKSRLHDELEREVTMSATAESIRNDDESTRSKTREGVHTITPYLVVSDVHQEID